MNLQQKIIFCLKQSNDLRRPPWKDHPNFLAGHCYIASEAFYHLTGRIYHPKFVRVQGQPHWFLEKNDNIVDLTAKQFDCEIPYEKAIGKGFLTKKPSKRALKLIERIK